MRLLKLFAFLTVSVFFLNGCGVKGYPKPPRSFNISGIKEINVKQMGEYLVIYWYYKKVYEDGMPIKEKLNFYLLSNDEKSKVNPYKNGDLYWVVEPIKNFENKICYKVSVRTVKTLKEKISNYVCIKPEKNYPVLTTKLNLFLKEDGILLNWKKMYEQVNIYRNENSNLIPPIPYKIVKNSSEFLDKNLELNKKYCYYITISKNGVESSSSKIVCKKYVDKFPPLPPTDGNILKENGKIVIVWEESPSKDVIGYLIYKNGKIVSEIPIKSYYFIDRSYKSGDYYEIVAVDKAGNRSKPLKIK